MIKYIRKYYQIGNKSWWENDKSGGDFGGESSL
jgi:hypothetical protein